MPASCADCESDPAQRDYYGCEGRDEQEGPGWIDPITEDEYFICPRKILSLTIIEWYEEYNYVNRFNGTAKPYTQQSAKWIEAVKEYEKALDPFVAIANGKTVEVK